MMHCTMCEALIDSLNVLLGEGGKGGEGGNESTTPASLTSLTSFTFFTKGTTELP